MRGASYYSPTFFMFSQRTLPAAAGQLLYIIIGRTDCEAKPLQWCFEAVRASVMTYRHSRVYVSRDIDPTDPETTTVVGFLLERPLRWFLKGFSEATIIATDNYSH